VCGVVIGVVLGEAGGAGAETRASKAVAVKPRLRTIWVISMDPATATAVLMAGC